MILDSLCEDSDSESNFAGRPLPTTPGTLAVWELAAQQGTILQLRQQNTCILEKFTNRLSALDATTRDLATTCCSVSPARVAGPTIYTYPATLPEAHSSPSSSYPSTCAGQVALPVPSPRTQMPPHTPAPLYQAMALPPHQPLTPRQQFQQAPLVTAELLDSASAPQRPKGTSFCPHLFVTRGDGCKKIEFGQAT